MRLETIQKLQGGEKMFNGDINKIEIAAYQLNDKMASKNQIR